MLYMDDTPVRCIGRRALPKQHSFDSGDAILEVLEDLVLPEADYLPAKPLKLERLTPIPLNVRLQLAAPEIGAGSWSNIVLGTPVPLAPIDIHRNKSRGEHHIRPPCRSS